MIILIIYKKCYCNVDYLIKDNYLMIVDTKYRQNFMRTLIFNIIIIIFQYHDRTLSIYNIQILIESYNSLVVLLTILLDPCSTILRT